MSTRTDDDRDLADEAPDDLADDLDSDPGDLDDDLDDDLDEAGESEPPDDDDDPPARGRAFGPRRVSVLLGGVAAVLVAFGAWGLVAAGDLRDAPGAHNSALVDTGRTAEVSAAVSNALNKIFSYSYDKTEVTEQAAAQVLRGDARGTYERLFAEVRAKAPGQKIVLTTRVVYAAVQSLDGDRARLLVFLDQSATRVDTNETSGAAAQLSITAKRERGQWVITDMAPR